MPHDIRARLTIYGHEEMSAKELRFFKKWICSLADEMQTHKKGDLSKKFLATLYKQKV